MATVGFDASLILKVNMELFLSFAQVRIDAKGPIEASLLWTTFF